MAYGIIEYNSDGLPKCEICGKYFKRVIAHARQKHFIGEREYKIAFGFDVSKGICSKESSEKSKSAVISNYSVIEKNLLEAGKGSRKQKGVSNPRVLSQQTINRLQKWVHSPQMSANRVEQGRAVGLSGLGNQKRWGNGV